MWARRGVCRRAGLPAEGAAPAAGVITGKLLGWRRSAEASLSVRSQCLRRTILRQLW